MMKKILSLCLVVVMLLGMVAMTASAEGEIAFDGYYVSLGDDISLNFTLTGLTAGQQYTVEVTDGNMGDEITVTADEDGTAVAKYTGLTPAMLDTKFTATCGTATIEKSIKDYCMWALTNMDLSNDVHALVVTLLMYAKDSQTYNGNSVTALDGLNDLQKALAVTAGAPENAYEAPVNDLDGAAITWGGPSVVLTAGVKYRFEFTGTLPEDGKFVATLDGVETELTVEDGATYVDFTALTPADLRKDVTIVAKDAEGTAISIVVTFSAERYAEWIADSDESEAAKNLATAVLAYADAAINYNAVGETNATHTVVYTHNDTSNLRHISTGALTAHELYRFTQIGGIWPGANNMPGSVVNVYARVGVDISDIDDGWTSSKKTLHWVYNYAVAKIVAENDPNSGYENVKTMYVNDSCCNTSTTAGYQFTVADYQIGDAFLARTTGGVYWTIIFLCRDADGVGKFLAINSSKYSYHLYLDADKTLAGVTITSPSGEKVNTFCGEAEYTYNEEASVWEYCYVLRPNNLANQAN